jgi:hypothetical protein
LVFLKTTLHTRTNARQQHTPAQLRLLCCVLLVHADCVTASLLLRMSPRPSATTTALFTSRQPPADYITSLLCGCNYLPLMHNARSRCHALQRYKIRPKWCSLCDM